MEMGFYDRCIARRTDNDTTVLQYFACEKPLNFCKFWVLCNLTFVIFGTFHDLNPCLSYNIIVKNNANRANYGTSQQEGHCKLKKY